MQTARTRIALAKSNLSFFPSAFLPTSWSTSFFFLSIRRGSKAANQGEWANLVTFLLLIFFLSWNERKRTERKKENQNGRNFSGIVYKLCGNSWEQNCGATEACWGWGSRCPFPLLIYTIGPNNPRMAISLIRGESIS